MKQGTWQQKAQQLRIKILQTVAHLGKGHLGGAFSCLDILTVLYYSDLLAEEDKFILSKGHSAIAQYVILQDRGFITAEDLDNFNQGGKLGEHPDQFINGVDVLAGSLGHGLNIACGFALAQQLDSNHRHIYVLLGDGECYEGSVWEAANFAAHHKLSSVTAIIDRNGLAATAATEDINQLEPFAAKWQALGASVEECNGHDHHQLFSLLAKQRKENKAQFNVIIAHTVKGKGVSFMENNCSWHHGAISQQDYQQALQELKADDCS